MKITGKNREDVQKENTSWTVLCIVILELISYQYDWNRALIFFIVWEKYSLQSSNLFELINFYWRGFFWVIANLCVCMKDLKRGPSWQVESKVQVVGGLCGWSRSSWAQTGSGEEVEAGADDPNGAELFSHHAEIVLRKQRHL